MPPFFNFFFTGFILGLVIGIRMGADFFCLPPASMIENIEKMNNAKVETQTVSNQLATAEMLKKKAQIDAETNEIRSKGFTKEVLAEKWIDAIANSKNRIIITDGKTPIMVQ